MNDADKYKSEDDFLTVAGRLVSEDRLGEAMNYLLGILEKEPENEKARAFLEQIEEIVGFRNLDIYGSTNLNMDPWS